MNRHFPRPVATVRTRGPASGHHLRRSVPDRRRTALVVLIALIASAFSMTVSPPWARAESSTINGASNPFFVFLRQGEFLYASSPGLGTVLDQDEEAAPSAGGGIYGPATEDGVWQVDVGEINSAPTMRPWEVVARSASGEDITGRVWSSLYGTFQSSAADLTYWVLNDTGYLYQVTFSGYNGVESRIRADAIGNPVVKGQCLPSYQSKQSDGGDNGWDVIPECGDGYRIFFDLPADDLPASARLGDRQVPVKPAPVETQDLAVQDLQFTAATTGSAAGRFTWSVTPRFTGAYWLEVDVDGDGSYDGPRDRRVQQYADGSGTYSYDFDGVDGQGDPIADCSVMRARIYYDKVGEVHIVQDDVEGRSGGVEVLRLNGPGSPDPTVFWDDTQLTGARENTTPQLDGTEGVDSTGGVHGWQFAVNSWGNNRVIEDWAFTPIDQGTGEISFGAGCLAVEKVSDATVDSRPGDTVTYTVRATNTGAADFTPETPAVVRDDLTDVLDDATYNADATSTRPGALAYAEPVLSWTGPLASGESVDLTYTVTLGPDGDGRVRNVAWVPRDPDDPQTPVCDPPQDGTDTVTGEPCAEHEQMLPRLRIDKSADRSTLPAVGDPVRYTVTVTNDGPGAFTAQAPASFVDDLTDVLDAATFGQDAEASTGEVSYEAPRLSWQGALDAGESATVTYTAIYRGDGDHDLRNVACVPAEQTVPGAAPCDVVQVPGSGLTAWKQVSSSDDPAVAGSVLTYTLYFANDGEAAAVVDHVDLLDHVTDDADVTAEPVSDDGLTVGRDGDRITITGSVPPGETSTVSYQVTVRPDGERGDDVAANFLVPNDPDDPPVAPPDPVCRPDDVDRPDCTVTPIGRLLVGKAVSADTAPVGTGTVLTYTLTFDNQGAGPARVDHTDLLADVLDDADLTTDPTASDDALSVSAVTGDAFTTTGELAAGQTVVVTYQVTVRDEAGRGNSSADNFLIPTGQEPPATCTDGDATCTVTPLPRVAVVKSSDPAPGAGVQAGQEVRYTLTFTNTGRALGAVDVTDDLAAVLDDADLTGAPVSSDPALLTSDGADGTVRVTGALAPDQTVTVGYTVTVRPDGERGDDRLRNVVVPTGTEPPTTCEPGWCTEHPVGALDVWKSVDPPAGSTLRPGDTATYTLHFASTGTAPVAVDREDVLGGVLDDADVTGQPVASGGSLSVGAVADGRFRVTGELDPGEDATVAYQVTVRPDGQRGDDRLENFLVPAGEDPPAGRCVPVDPERPDCTVNHVSDVTVEKSSDPESGTRVAPGQEVSYTITFVNRSADPQAAPAAVDHTDDMSGVLDDAVLVAGPTVSGEDLSATTGEGSIRITGTVAPGEVRTVTYTVQVKPYDQQGDHRLANVVAPTGEEPVCAEGSPLCTWHESHEPPVPPAPPAGPRGWLPFTGAQVTSVVVAVLALLGLGGAAVLVGRRRGGRRDGVGREVSIDDLM